MSFSNVGSQENFLAFHIFGEVEYLLYLLKMTLSPPPGSLCIYVLCILLR